jgi:hypothetical protein
VVVRPFVTFARVVYNKGDVLTIARATCQAPYGYESPICNFLVNCRHFPLGTVWSGIWKMLEEGSVVFEGEEDDDNDAQTSVAVR